MARRSTTKARIRTGEGMSAESAVPLQVLQGLPKGKLFSEGSVSSKDAELLNKTVFAPFTGDGLGLAGTAEGGSSTERDLLLMEHLPTVRYLARRIHERLPQQVELDDRVSAGIVGLMGAFSKFA